MEETGRVTKTNGNRAEVEVAARGECTGCSAHGICHSAGGKSRRVLAVNNAGARTGDTVVLDLSGSRGIRSNLVVFGIPALAMLAGVLVGGLVMKRDLWAGILSGIGLAAGLAVVKLVDSSVSRSGKTLPVVVRLADTSAPKGVTGDEMVDGSSGCGDGRHG
jgi:positive regulator of sigma E activity